ncbi:MAG: ABC transporter ATP-binding protein, partial [Pseudomonadota bacterium]
FSSRPGHIIREVRVRLPKPRNDARLTPEFLAYVKEIAGVLGSAAGAGSKAEKKKELRHGDDHHR